MSATLQCSAKYTGPTGMSAANVLFLDVECHRSWPFAKSIQVDKPACAAFARLEHL